MIKSIWNITRSSIVRYNAILLFAALALLFLWPQLWQNLFSTDGFMTHYECYLRKPELVWMHLTSDFLIGVSYVTISISLTYLVYRARHDMPFHWVFIAFGLFIIACGGTHFMEVWNTWTPTYWLAGYLKLITAVASVATALILPPLLPKTLIFVRAVTVSEELRLKLEAVNEELESRVQERTADLSTALEFLRETSRARVANERKIRESEARYRSLMLASSHITWTNNAEGEMHGEQPAWAAFTGQSETEYQNYGWADAVHPDDREHTIGQWKNAVETRSVFEDEHRVRRHDGQYRTFSVRAVPVIEADGTVREWSGAHTDITEQKQTMQALEESRERFRFMADAMPQIVWTSRPDGNLDYYNQRWYDYTGMTFEQSKDWGWEPVLHPDDLQNCIEQWTNSIATAADYEVQYRFKRAADGEYRWHLGRALPMRNADGEITLWVGTCTDIDDSKRVEKELENAREELEHRVATRTADLTSANSALTQQINERKQLENALRQERMFLRTLIDNLPDFVYVKDTSCRKVMANLAVVRFSGLQSEAEMLGKDDFEIYPKEIAEQFYVDDQMVLQTGQSVINREEFVINKSGRKSWLLTTKIPLHDESNRIIGLIGIGRDITQRKGIESELEEARDIALESVRLKSEFLANMSHEIRTPMNGVIGMTDLLLDTDLTEIQKDYTETIQSSADALLTIIDDILDFSKIEAGQLRFEKIDFDLREAVEAPVEMLAERAAIKGLELASLVYKDVPTLLRGDPGRLRQVLTNLIGNAIKFTEAGEVIVSASLEKETNTSATLRFEITDTGIGISDEAQRRLFSAFMQADGSTTRKYGGTGLGLAISKQLVELMGGQIGIKSTPEAGSTFWFTGIFEKQSEAAIKQPQSAPAVSIEGVRVLIVDDNATNRQIILHQTSSWGMLPTEAETGAQAITLLRAAVAEGAPYDIALLDLMMPDMNGFLLAGAIKSDKDIAGVRLVLLPSFGKRGHGESARQAGIAAYLQKPVRQSQLYDCLVAVMAQSPDDNPGTSSRLVTRHSLRETETMHNTPPEFSSLRVLVAEDNPVNRKVALSQLRNLGYRADAAANGREVIKALEKSDYDIIFMDCQMPEMDGFEATAEIRLRQGTARRTTIIAMTANALEGDREKCLAAGMDDYISKPVKADILRETLERWLAPPSSQTPSVEPATQDSNSGEGEEDAVDLSVLATYKELEEGGQPGLVNELIDLFIEHTTQQLIGLREAAARRDTEKIKFFAHTLKGSSANMGVLLMAKIGEELETKSFTDEAADAMIARLEKEFARVRKIIEGQRDLNNL